MDQEAQMIYDHCVKSVQIKYFVFSPNAGKYGPEKTPYLDTFYTLNLLQIAEISNRFLMDSNHTLFLSDFD